ncbi:MAG: RNB domain-containing ribonuclease [Galbitalea sp.]
MPSHALRLAAVPAAGPLAEALAAIPVALGISRDFPAGVIAEAASAAAHPALPEPDDTDVPYVTIDPAGSMDLDQAFCLERSGGGYRVRYAIADVPSFVRPGGALDAEARRRGQTIYPQDGPIPLHPLVLSNGAASLLPGQVRGAFVWDFTLDAAANVTSTTLSRARVRSTAQLDYVGVQRAIDRGTTDTNLLLLKEIGLKRIERELARGAANLTLPETEVNEVGGGYELVRRRPQPAEDWNAQLSLLTGMAAAELMIGARVGILRTMPEPEQFAIDRFRRQALALGRPWPQSQRYGEYLRALDTTDPRQLAIMHAAGQLFRGAGYTPSTAACPSDSSRPRSGRRMRTPRLPFGAWSTASCSSSARRSRPGPRSRAGRGRRCRHFRASWSTPPRSRASSSTARSTRSRPRCCAPGSARCSTRP